MKTKLLFSALICALFFVTSCTKDTGVEPINQNNKSVPHINTTTGGYPMTPKEPEIEKPKNEL